MSQQQQIYSAHPDLAAEQLQRAEASTSVASSHRQPQATAATAQSAAIGSSRRHVKATPKKYTSRSCTAHVTPAGHSGSPAQAETVSCKPKTQPVRTNYADVDDDDDIDGEDIDDVNFGKLKDDEIKIISYKTKDCVSITTQQQKAQPQQRSAKAAAAAAAAAACSSIDEPDYVQQRFNKRHTTQNSRQTTSFAAHQHLDDGGGGIGEGGGGVGAGKAEASGSISDLSSVISSPSGSTVSSPLSTPTRLPQQLQHSHQHCCQKGAAALASAGVSRARPHHSHQHQQKPHHHHHHHHGSSSLATCAAGAGAAAAGGGVGAAASAGASAAAGVGGIGVATCKSKKLDPRFNASSPYRQLLPIILCLLSFAVVFATLIVYMDTTEIRHQQFRLNMSRDYELNGVPQDDPALIAFLRQIHMQKYPMHFGKTSSGDAASAKPAGTGSFGVDSPYTSSNLSSHSSNSSSFGGSGVSGSGSADELAHYVANLLSGKLNGAVIQSLTGPLAHLITAPWLSDQLNWMGVLVEPEPRWYFSLRKQNVQRPRMQVVHACVSPNTYPKEITIHNEDVRINSLHDEETSWFNSRVKCFPLYTIMLACERTEYELLSLGVQGHELEILQTLPFDKIKIDVISIHLLEDHEDAREYVQSITKFLAGKSYKLLQRKFGRNFFYQRLNAVSRTRKKDILLLKTP